MISYEGGYNTGAIRIIKYKKRKWANSKQY